MTDHASTRPHRVVKPVRYQPRWPWWRKAFYYAMKPLRRQPEFDDWECE